MGAKTKFFMRKRVFFVISVVIVFIYIYASWWSSNTSTAVSRQLPERAVHYWLVRSMLCDPSFATAVPRIRLISSLGPIPLISSRR